MSTAVTTKNENKVAKTESIPASERFTMAVIKEFPNGMNGNELELTSFQRKLIQNYFIKVDMVLQEAETKRMYQSEQKRDIVPVNWNNVNMKKLALDVVAYSSIGLDPLQKNHISPIPYKNNKTGLYDINLMEGFVGIELKARKYGYDIPDDVIFELKYSTDIFKSIKKSIENKVENYHFEITNDFDRGELEGGFYYKIYRDNPEKNQLVVMNRNQIEKRKPKYASAEFWGGEKPIWKNGQVTKETEKIEGWEEEMFLKTLKRHCWDKMPIDSQKIDDFLVNILQNEAQEHDMAVADQIKEGANKKEIGMGDVKDEIEPTGYEEASEDEIVDAIQDDRPGALDEWNRRESLGLISKNDGKITGPGF